MTELRQGSAHGRFQPLHLGHLEYLLATADACDFLWVGITQPESGDLRSDLAQPAHRYEAEANPLTYWERNMLVEAALVESGMTRDRFRIVPFPIERPHVLPDYVPLDVRIYTTIYDEWNLRKITVLENVGYDVAVLWERSEKEFVGRNIREQLRGGDSTWETLVPASTVGLLKEFQIAERLAKAH